MPSKIIDSFFRNSEDSYFGINEKYNSWMKQVVNNKKKKFFNKSSFKWLNNKSLYTKQIIKFLSLSLSLSISHSLSLISIKKKNSLQTQFISLNLFKNKYKTICLCVREFDNLYLCTENGK